jgi:hypothetical protein
MTIEASPELSAALARAEAAEQLLIDFLAQRSRAYQPASCTRMRCTAARRRAERDDRTPSEVALHYELEQLDDARLSMARGLAAELLAAAKREILRRDVEGKPDDAS